MISLKNQSFYKLLRSIELIFSALINHLQWHCSLHMRWRRSWSTPPPGRRPRAWSPGPPRGATPDRRVAGEQGDVLDDGAHGRGRVGDARHEHLHGVVGVGAQARGDGGQRGVGVAGGLQVVEAGDGGVVGDVIEIGRASCRERV